jgi:hypothetical protein
MKPGPFRALSATERAVLLRMLEPDFPGNEELREQLSHSIARDIAGPGDHEGTIEIRVNGNFKAPIESRLPVVALANDDDGIGVEFLLHVDNGIIYELEVVKADGSPIRRLPLASELRVEVFEEGKQPFKGD